jgi:hypothetical protein
MRMHTNRVVSSVAVALLVVGLVGLIGGRVERHNARVNAQAKATRYNPPPTLTVTHGAATASTTTTVPANRPKSAEDLLRGAGCTDVTTGPGFAYCVVQFADGGVGSLTAYVFDSNARRDAELARSPGPALVGERWIVIGNGLGAVQAKIGGTVRKG